VLERVHTESEPERSAPGPAERGTPAASVLGLQRRIGNAAVTRLLQRQEVEELGPSPPASDRICGTVAPSTHTGPPTRLDPLDPVIGTVAGPCLDDWFGGYSWYVTYTLPQPAPSGGFLIQELYQQGSGGSSEHFWECWRIRSGEQDPPARTNTPAGVTPSGLYDDRYIHGNVPGATHATSGWYRHVGQARFYPGPLPPEFGTESPGVHSYITRTRPAGWTGAGARHDCYAEWGRRTSGRFRGLVAFAGTTEYRAGDRVTDAQPRPSFTPGP
jgi:hypothetical protein